MNVSAASLAPDSSVRKETPSDITERTARSGAVVETIFLSTPRRARCTVSPAWTGYTLQLPPHVVVRDANNVSPVTSVCPLTVLTDLTCTSYHVS